MEYCGINFDNFELCYLKFKFLEIKLSFYNPLNLILFMSNETTDENFIIQIHSMEDINSSEIKNFLLTILN